MSHCATRSISGCVKTTNSANSDKKRFSLHVLPFLFVFVPSYACIQLGWVTGLNCGNDDEWLTCAIRHSLVVIIMWWRSLLWAESWCLFSIEIANQPRRCRLIPLRAGRAESRALAISKQVVWLSFVLLIWGLVKVSLCRNKINTADIDHHKLTILL